MPAFESSFGPPVDPAYTRFVDGLKRYLVGADAPSRWRWHPLDSKWYSYPIANFILEDVGLGKTATPAVWSLDAGRRQLATFHSWDLAPLFKRVAQDYGKFSARYPHAVWSARTGEWRSALKRVASSPVPVPDPAKPGRLPQEALERIAKVREAERLGFISNDQADKLIFEIVEEYT